jgi:hypothetical protein
MHADQAVPKIKNPYTSKPAFWFQQNTAMRMLPAN